MVIVVLEVATLLETMHSGFIENSLEYVDYFHHHVALYLGANSNWCDHKCWDRATKPSGHGRIEPCAKYVQPCVTNQLI
jgi:hypothetical protein